MKLPGSPLVALSVGMLGSAAANTAWTWEHGPVRVIAGLFATALVPVGMHLWPRVPITGRVTQVLRVLAMSYICCAAAVVNLVHAMWLLTGHPTDGSENPILAFLLISAVEAVMVMASLAWRRRQFAADVTAPVADAAAPELPVDGPATSAPAPGVVAPAQEQPPPDLDEEAELARAMSPAEFAEHRLEHGSTAGVKKLRKHYPALTEHQARQVSETARREHHDRHTPRLVVGGER